MPKSIATDPSIVGNVHVESVTVNTKGGSLAAILRRSIRGELATGKRCYGAKIEFEPGVSCVLMAPGRIKRKHRTGELRKVRVSRISQHRYVITLENDAEELTDAVTSATLKILEDMLKSGKLTLVTQDELGQRLSKMIKEGDNAALAAKRRMLELQMK